MVRVRRLALGALLLAAVGAYANAFAGVFLFDDRAVILDDTRLASPAAFVAHVGRDDPAVHQAHVPDRPPAVREPTGRLSPAEPPAAPRLRRARLSHRAAPRREPRHRVVDDGAVPAPPDRHRNGDLHLGAADGPDDLLLPRRVPAVPQGEGNRCARMAVGRDDALRRRVPGALAAGEGNGGRVPGAARPVPDRHSPEDGGRCGSRPRGPRARTSRSTSRLAGPSRRFSRGPPSTPVTRTCSATASACAGSARTWPRR